MIETVILAGGTSSRFSRNKLNELYKGKPILVHTLETFLKVSDRVILVTGHYDADYISAYLDMTKIYIVQNDKYDLGMFSSVQTGVNETTADFFLIPGDYPLVKVDTLHKLLSDIGDIRVPTYFGRKGHPIFIHQSLKKELMKEPVSSNLKVFRDRYTVTFVAVDDKGILQDVDYQNDLSKLKIEGNDLP